MPILYSSADVGTLMNVHVPAAISITSVTATLSVTYPRVSDLNVYIFGPDGTRTKLLEKNCSGTPNATLVNASFDDSASTRFANFCPAEPGRGPFQGNEPLSNFKGKVSYGTWSLFVENNGSDTNFGTVDAFSITINGTSLTPSTITGVANAVDGGSPGAISPGELVAVSGTNLGPNPGVISKAATLPTTLGGVQLTFNDQPVPLYYVSANLIAGVVPYQAIPGNPATIGGQVTAKVIYNGVASAGLPVNLISSTPAVFTVASGVSNTLTVNAINADGTANSTTNRAAAGSYVSIYASGLGAVTPSGFQAGSTAPSTTLFSVVGPTFVSVAGQSATVQFAGLAPGTISVYQVNAQIPAGTPAGAQPIVVSNMVGASAPLVNIWVK
jgi:uncharacterized protein (TIGR03437 family)